MSSVDPFSKGSTLLTYRLGERNTSSVWQAEDTRNGKKVAIKILSRQLPKDPGKREALLRDVRQGAALYHSSLIHIQEIAPAGEALLLVMEWFDGHPIAGRVRGNPLDRKAFFRIAYQIGDALKLLHGKNVIHGNVAGDSILLAASGQVKLAGLNISNLLTRQGQLSVFGQKGTDARAVAYMSPEQISNAGITVQTDIFSLGLVLFEAAAGRLPYQAPTAAEIARKIVEEPLPSPKSFNPNIDNAVLSVMGKCLFKDPFRRYKDARAMLEDIAKVDPETAKFAAELSKGGLSLPSSGQAQTQATRTSILLLADVANYASLMNTDQPEAAKATARMQQILGEAVYLFDGEVIDPFGPRLVAELKSVESAVEAGRKGEFDFSAEQQGANPIPVRFLLHAGELEVRDGKPGGAGVTKGFEVLQSVPPLKLHISEDFLKKGRPNLRLRDSGARAGVKLYTIVEPEPQPVAETQIDEAAEEAAVAEEEAAALAAAAAAKKKRQTMIVAAAAGLVLLLGGGAAVLLLKPKPTETVAPVVTKKVVATSTEPQPATAATPRKILLEPFAVEGTDPALGVRANVVRLASIETLRAFPEVRIADGPAPDATAFTATVRTGTAGPEIVTTSTATPMIDAASGIQTVVQHVSSQLNLPPRSSSTAQTYNAFADAVVANAANDAKKTEASLRAAIKAEPTFMPAQLMAMRFFAARGKENDAVAAARQVVAADSGNLEAARMVARFSLKSGDLASAFANFALVLRKEPADAEALNVIGRYAYSAYDIDKFRAVLRRLAGLPSAAASIHEPDLIVATGRIDTAVDRYYAVEENVKDNPALALKIGRIAVLRHSTPIAELEFKRLQETDPNYGLHILKAYLAASAGVRTDTDSELKAALAASRPGDDYWTNVAEINVISGNSAAVLPALQRAVERKEPTVSYILSNPLFQFLSTDPEYQKLRQKMVEQQKEIRTALAGVPL